MADYEEMAAKVRAYQSAERMWRTHGLSRHAIAALIGFDIMSIEDLRRMPWDGLAPQLRMATGCGAKTIAEIATLHAG